MTSAENEWSELHQKAEGENPHNMDGWHNKLDRVVSKIHPNVLRDYREASLQRLLSKCVYHTTSLNCKM